MQRAIELEGVNGVVVVHHESMRRVAGDARAELLRRPFRCRILRDVLVNEAACADVEHDEHVEESEPAPGSFSKARNQAKGNTSLPSSSR